MCPICLINHRSKNILLLMFRRHISTKANTYKKCYDLLKVSPESDQETIREAYLKIVKSVHPDSGHPDASAEKFAEIDNAFRILQSKFAKERRGIRVEDDGVKEFDIKHTAPQHRQFLSYDGLGCGSPAQREKQYQQSRASKAYGKVIEYRVDKAKASDNAIMKPGTFFKNHAIKTKYGFDRVVEDLIQEAMSKGDFENLSGSGKPLTHAQSQNPYVDFVQHKMNNILLDNGFTPEWITMQKEIRTEKQDLMEILTKYRSYLGKEPLSSTEQEEWDNIVEKQQTRLNMINQKIDKYNLIVPILDQQIIHFELNRIAEHILKTGPSCMAKPKVEPSQNADSGKGILSYLVFWS